MQQHITRPATLISGINYNSSGTSFDNSDICDIQENDFLLFGNKTLVLNSVLAYAFHKLGPINAKLLSYQLSEFYNVDKLLSAYKLVCSLCPNPRNLRQKQDPRDWKINTLSQHILNQIKDLQNLDSDIIFASLDLDVPLRELSKPPSNAATGMRKFLNFGKKEMSDKGCQCPSVTSVSSNTTIATKHAYVSGSKPVLWSSTCISASSADLQAGDTKAEVPNHQQGMTNNAFDTTLDIVTGISHVETALDVKSSVNPLATEVKVRTLTPNDHISPDSSKTVTNNKSVKNNYSNVNPLVSNDDLCEIPSVPDTLIPLSSLPTDINMAKVNPLYANGSAHLNELPNTSTPISIPPTVNLQTPPQAQMPLNSEILEALNSNNETLLGIHKTLLRRLPKANKIQKKSVSAKKNTSNLSRNFTSIMREIQTADSFSCLPTPNTNDKLENNIKPNVISPSTTPLSTTLGVSTPSITTTSSISTATICPPFIPPKPLTTFPITSMFMPRDVGSYSIDSLNPLPLIPPILRSIPHPQLNPMLPTTCLSCSRIRTM